MIEFKTIRLPKDMPVHRRISEAARQVREWTDSHEMGSDPRRHQIRLLGIQEKKDVYAYRYVFLGSESPLVPEEDEDNDEEAS